MPIDPRRVKALFNAALDLSDPADRPALLDHECGGDVELRARLDDLLAAYDLPAEAVGRPLVKAALPDGSDPVPTVAATGHPAEVGGRAGPDETATADFRPGPAGPVVGTVVAGRYKVRQEIGEGGMGSVYLAEQTQPVRRQVALKLIKAGMDSRTVLARFESERQALALMDHPNIARVLDAGTTDAGRPYFVMDLVKGIPLTDYCDAHRLDLPARLAIFRQVCSAVQHAHQKGVIHRDLKPTNILVESHDGRPVPKVIDFGLAKATTGMPLTDQSLFTAFGSVTGTPLYMAPEQASFNALDVDTRADIYALGVILYELLTGSTPIRRDTVQRAALDEMLRVIREDDPPTPSSRISTSEGLAGIAATRHIDPSRLSRFVRGDLDWIVMKALAKERHRRYDSAIGLANDVERFTNHEPVSAGPPTAGYRVRKFARRNRGQVVAASLVLLVLVGGIVGTTFGLIEARRQEREAIRQENIAVAEAAEKGKALQSEAQQRRQAEGRLGQIAKINTILGSIFENLDPKAAEKEGKPLSYILGQNLDRATAEIEDEAIGDPLAVARIQAALGQSQLGLGYPEKAIVLITKARATFTSRLGPDHPDTLTSMGNLAVGYQAAGQLDRALPLFEETLALKKAKLGPDHPETLASMSNLAAGYQAAGQLDRALPLFEETLALKKAKLGPDHPHTLPSMNNLALGYQAVGQLDRALPLFEETLALKKAKLGPDHPETLASMNNLAAGYQAVGQLDRALPLFEETLALTKAKLGPDHPHTLVSMSNLASGYQAVGQLDRALPLFEETLALTKAKLGPDHPHTLVSMNNLAAGYKAVGKVDRAIPLLREAAEIWKRKTSADSPQCAGAMALLCSALLQGKRWIEAEPVLRECLAIREAKEPDAWTTFNTKSMLGAALFGQKKYADSDPLLRAGYEGMKARADKIPAQSKFRVGQALERLIELARVTDKPDDVRTWRAERAKWPEAPAPKPVADKE